MALAPTVCLALQFSELPRIQIELPGRCMRRGAQEAIQAFFMGTGGVFARVSRASRGSSSWLTSWRRRARA
eukprot:3059145-Alexandrium_andersonii.AAC.1